MITADDLRVSAPFAQLPGSELAKMADREPMLLETSIPGVFAAGDTRSGWIKRVASAVGEGSMAITLIHRHLRDIPTP